MKGSRRLKCDFGRAKRRVTIRVSAMRVTDSPLSFSAISAGGPPDRDLALHEHMTCQRGQRTEVGSALKRVGTESEDATAPIEAATVQCSAAAVQQALRSTSITT